MLTRTLGRALLAGAGVAASWGGASVARADSCTSADFIETIPADMATGIPLNASLFARYDTNAQYLGEPVTMNVTDGSAEDAGGGDGGGPGAAVPVSVSFDAAEGLLEATPVGPLTPGVAYVVHWPSLRGVDTATLGESGTLHFTAGTGNDDTPPTFAGVSSVTWDVSRENDSCTNRIEERYEFTIGLGAATDDGGRDALTLIVFQTSGPGVDASEPVPVLTQRMPPVGQSVTVTSNDLVGHVCFAAIVQDLTGKASTSGAPACVDTVAPPFFYSCAIGDGRHGDGGAGALTGMTCVVLLARRRTGARRRRERRREGAG